MKLIMTVMVRDEADIIGSMLQHHAAQGVDEFIITDNGSTDGTTEIIEDLARSMQITLFHDPIHRKQQGETVTRMARMAADHLTIYRRLIEERNQRVRRQGAPVPG